MITQCARLFEKSRRSDTKSIWEYLLWKLCCKIKLISEWFNHFVHHPSWIFEIHTNHKSTSDCSQYVETACYLMVSFTKRRWMRSILINTNWKNRCGRLSGFQRSKHSNEFNHQPWFQQPAPKIGNKKPWFRSVRRILLIACSKPKQRNHWWKHKSRYWMLMILNWIA